MVTRTATNNATFASAVTASVNGDIIVLSAGNYGIYSSGKQFTGTLLVKSADYLNPAVFSYIDLPNARGWTFEDVKFDLPYTAGVSDASCSFGGSGSQRIKATRCEFKHNNEPSTFAFGRAVAFFNADSITIEHCKVWRAKNGIVFSNSNNIIVTRTEVTDMGSDAIDFYSCSNVVCTYNFLHKWRPDWNAGAHCDAIQTASFVGEIVPINNTISNNIIDIEDGAWLQNIFNRSEVFDDTGGNATYRFSGFTIENNWIKGAFQYGIQVAPSMGVTTVRNNTMIYTAMNMSDPYNAASVAAPEPDNHDGPNSTQAIPVMYVLSTTGSGFLTGNRWYGGSYYSGARLFLTTPQATMQSQGWTISDNVVDKDSAGPARPTFTTDFGTGTTNIAVTRNASTQAELNTAFGLSVPGDIINITGWSGAMTWTARNYASNIFIIGNNNTASSLTISNSSFIHCSGLNIMGPSSMNAVQDVFFAENTTNPDITLQNCFMGSSNWASITQYDGFFNPGGGDSHCIMCPSTSTALRLIIRGCRLKGRKYAGTFYGISGAMIENNDIDYISSDSFKVVGVMGGGTIRNNLFPRRHFPYPGVPPGDSLTGDHADVMVQFTSNNSGWTLNGNVFLPLIDDLFGFSGVIFGSNGLMTNMTTYQNLMVAPGDAGIILEDNNTSSHTNNTALTYFPSGYIVSQTQIETNGGIDLRNYEGTYRADLSTVNKLTNNPAGATGTRINSVYQTRWGASVDAHLYKMEPIDFTPVSGGPADFATNGVNTKGAYDTIAKLLNGTWPGPAWDGPTPSGGVTPPVVVPPPPSNVKTTSRKVLLQSARQFRRSLL